MLISLRKTAHASAVDEFLTTYKLLPGYCINIARRYTTIDFLFVTKNVNYVTEYKTLDNESNHSDHLGLLLSLNLPSSSDIFEFTQKSRFSAKKHSETNGTKTDDGKRLRWDKTYTNAYNDLWRELLYPLLGDIDMMVNSSISMMSVLFLWMGSGVAVEANS